MNMRTIPLWNETWQVHTRYKYKYSVTQSLQSKQETLFLEVPRLIGRNSGEIIIFVSSKQRRLQARNFKIIYFSILLAHKKRPALHNKRVGVLRMAFRIRKVFGTFDKRAPGRVESNSGLTQQEHGNVTHNCAHSTKNPTMANYRVAKQGVQLLSSNDGNGKTFGTW